MGIEKPVPAGVARRRVREDVKRGRPEPPKEPELPGRVETEFKRVLAVARAEDQVTREDIEALMMTLIRGVDSRLLALETRVGRLEAERPIR